MGDRLATSLTTDIKVHRQFGPNDVRRVGVPCMVGITLDIEGVLNRLGEKALRSKGKRATAFYGALVVQVKEVRP